MSRQVLMEVLKVSIPVCTTPRLLKQMLCITAHIGQWIPSPFRRSGLWTVLLLLVDLLLHVSDLIQLAAIALERGNSLLHSDQADAVMQMRRSDLEHARTNGRCISQILKWQSPASKVVAPSTR